ADHVLDRLGSADPTNADASSACAAAATPAKTDGLQKLLSETLGGLHRHLSGLERGVGDCHRITGSTCAEQLGQRRVPLAVVGCGRRRDGEPDRHDQRRKDTYDGLGAAGTVVAQEFQENLSHQYSMYRMT